MKKFLDQALSAVLVLLVIFLVFLAYGTLNNRWYKVITVQGNSMSPTLWFGDLIVITPPTEKLLAGDILTMSVNGSLVTHRLVGFDAAGQPITKGDDNEIEDKFSYSDLQIVGIYRFRLPGFG
jgi:signal peptidase I